MKRHYWLIILFVAWCLGSAWWYMDGVKGVKTAPQFFSPQASSISIIEILVMLLIACLIGYAIAWSVRGESIEEQADIREKIQSDNSSLQQLNNDLRSQTEMWRNKHQHDLSFSQQKANEAISDRDRLQRQLNELESATPFQQQGSFTSQAQLETEAGTLRYRIRQLEFQNKEHEESYAK